MNFKRFTIFGNKDIFSYNEIFDVGGRKQIPGIHGYAFASELKETIISGIVVMNRCYYERETFIINVGSLKDK